MILWTLINDHYEQHWGFPGGSDHKESTCNEGDTGSATGSGRFSGGGNGNPLQYSCLENSMYRRVWWATAHGIAKSQKRLSDLTLSLSFINSSMRKKLDNLDKMGLFLQRHNLLKCILFLQTEEIVWIDLYPL